MPSRKPAAPVVVEAVDWTAVLRPDHGRVSFPAALRTLRKHGVRFDPTDLCPEVFVGDGNDSFRLASSDEPGCFVGWMIER